MADLGGKKQSAGVGIPLQELDCTKCVSTALLYYRSQIPKAAIVFIKSGYVLFLIAKFRNQPSNMAR
jgi:hypothetical protein